MGMIRTMSSTLSAIRQGGTAIRLPGYAIVFALFFAPVWSNGLLLAPADAWLQSVPAYLAGWQLWTPYLLNGMPVAADPTTMSLYPPMLLCQWLGVPWNLFLVSAYLIAASGMHLWMELATGNRTAAMVAALTFTLGGFFMVHLQHVTMIHASAWITFVLFGIELLRHGRHRTGILSIVAGVSMSILAGHPQLTFYGLVLSLFYAFWLLTQLSQGQRTGFLMHGAAAVFCGMLTAAVFLLPVAELAAASNRAEIDVDYFLSYSLNLRDAIQLLFPMLWGSHGGAPYGVTYFGGETHAGQGYSGALSLMLATAVLLLRKHRRQTLFWVVVAVAALLLAMGGSTPLGHWMYQVPGYNMFRVPSRNLFELVLALSVLSAFAVAALASMDRVRRMATVNRAIILVLFLHLLAFTAVKLAEPQIAEAALKWAGISRWQANLANGAIWVPLAALLVVTLLFRFWAGQPHRFAPLLLAVVIGTGSYSWFENWRYDSKWTLPNPVPHSLATLQESDERFLGGKLFSRFDPPVENNWPLVWGVKSAAAYNPLLPLRYRTLLGMSAFGSVEPSVYSPSNVALDLLAVRHLYADAALAALLERFPERYERVGESAEAVHYINLRALPRFRFARHARGLNETAALAAIRSSRLVDGAIYHPERMTLLNGDTDRSDFADGEVEVIAERGRELLLHTRSEGEALLVAADAWFPGWHVEVDGVETELLQADYVNRAVIVAQGEHEVRFYYRPYAFCWGAAISLLGLLLTWLLARRRQ